jgi:hypothetical protein
MHLQVHMGENRGGSYSHKIHTYEIMQRLIYIIPYKK